MELHLERLPRLKGLKSSKLKALSSCGSGPPPEGPLRLISASPLLLSSVLTGRPGPLPFCSPARMAVPGLLNQGLRRQFPGSELGECKYGPKPCDRGHPCLWPLRQGLACICNRHKAIPRNPKLTPPRQIDEEQKQLSTQSKLRV